MQRLGQVRLGGEELLGAGLHPLDQAARDLVGLAAPGEEIVHQLQVAAHPEGIEEPLGLERDEVLEQIFLQRRSRGAVRADMKDEPVFQEEPSLTSCPPRTSRARRCADA